MCACRNISTATRFLFKFGIGGALQNLIELFHFRVKNLTFFSQTRSYIYHDSRTPIDVPQGRGGTIGPRIAAVHLAAASQTVSQIQKYSLVPFPSLVLAPFLQQYRLAIPRNEGRYRIQRSPTPSHKTFSRYVMQHASLLQPRQSGESKINDTSDSINPVRTKLNLSQLKTQSVPRSKHCLGYKNR
jgi:hypothetical protein